MERTTLLSKLTTVEPALSKTDMIPILSHLCFTGKEVYAYNDAIAIIVPLPSAFKGAIPGSVLLSLLNKSKAKEVNFEVSKTELSIQAASSKLKLASRPVEDFVFDIPKLPEKADIILTPAIIEGIEHCLMSVGLDTSIPDQLGVTFDPDGDTLALYATNNLTLSRSRLKLKKPTKLGRCILATDFCRQLLRLAGGDPVPLYLDDEAAVAKTPKGILYGKLIDTRSPVDFADLVEQHAPKGYKDRMVDMPSKLKLVLERAMIITEHHLEPTATEIRIEKGVARFKSESERGEVRDMVRLDDKHPDAVIKLDPKLLHKGFGIFEKMLLSDRGVIMAKGPHLFMVASAE